MLAILWLAFALCFFWLRVTLWWLVQKPVTRDHKVFVHAVDTKGQIVAQYDSMPRNDAAPTGQWRSGQIVMDVHEFQALPDSTGVALQINVGLYGSLNRTTLENVDRR